MIDFSRYYTSGKEIQYINDAIRRNHISGDGYYTKKVSNFFEKKFGIKKMLLTTSCTAALEIASLLLDLKVGDEVIMPSFTFVSTANAVVLRNAKPVFVDINPNTMNIDVSKIEDKITEKTRAIFVVHYAGVSCDMDLVMDIAEKYNLKVVEDAAQGVNSTYKGKYLGTIGHLGCYSFHETKNYTCGEGGALLINGDVELAERAEIIREKGTNRSQFFRGEISRYSWVDIGSSYLLSEINAAFLYAQMEVLDYVQEKRASIVKKYDEGLKSLYDSKTILKSIIPDECKSNYHIYYILTQEPDVRNKLLNYLRKNNIHATFHYIPLHQSKMGEELGCDCSLEITTNCSERLIRLPLYVDLTDEELNQIVECIYTFFEEKLYV